MNKENLYYYDNVINDLNGLLVDIHCKLGEKNIDLNDYLKIQLELHNAYTICKILIYLYNKTMKMFLKNEKVIIKRARLNVQNDLSDKIIKLNIIKRNIERQLRHLRKLLFEYVYGKAKPDDISDSVYTIIYMANGGIIDYLYKKSSAYKQANIFEKVIMVELLQKYLNSECDDLSELLNMAKEKVGNDLGNYEQKYQSLNDFLNEEREQELIKTVKSNKRI